LNFEFLTPPFIPPTPLIKGGERGDHVYPRPEAGSGDSDKHPPAGSIVPINKPAGISSFDVVRRIRWATGVRKVGHGGTLDPFAEGVLLIGIGRSATRRLGEFLMADKEYLARVVLGVVTDTCDPTGKVIERNPPLHPSSFILHPSSFRVNTGRSAEDIILETMRKFEGEILQVPPLFSAIKVNGVRSYRVARRGGKLELKPRKVNIKRIELVGLTSDGFDMSVTCSHGTYIRSLAYDLGRELGPGAHLGALVRTRIGQYTLEMAENLEEFIDKAVSS